MLAHGQSGGIGILCHDGIADRAVLGERGVPRFRVLEIMRQLGEVGIEPLIEEFADHADQHGVIQASGHRDVEGAVAGCLDNACLLYTSDAADE